VNSLRFITSHRLTRELAAEIRLRDSLYRKSRRLLEQQAESEMLLEAAGNQIAHMNLELGKVEAERDAALDRLVDVFHHNAALIYELQMLENLSPDLLEDWEDRVSKTANKIKQAAKEKEATE